MIKNNYNVIGVMSGTSLDGIDLAYINFIFTSKWNFEIYVAETISYPQIWEDRLQNLVSLSSHELKKLDEEYTIFLSQIINMFIKKHHITGLDIVSTHGHTALHQPHKQLTYQIGNLPNLATMLNIKVVCDFRVEDVELGGQGAPLVPIGDKLLFSEYDYCLNLGGFANISTQNNNTVIAYDICPVNIVLNHYIKQIGLDYDDKGGLSSKGTVNINLLHKLNSLEFYHKNYPKSLGIEWVNSFIFPVIDAFQLKLEDVLRTYVEHIAIQISNQLNKKHNASVLVTGGGVFNEFLIQRIETLTSNQIYVPSKNLLEYKEALIFGLLGVLKLRQEINCISSVTGAKFDHSSGKIYNP